MTMSKKTNFPSTPASNDNRASDVRLDQYYTRPDVATRFYETFKSHYDPKYYQMVEPSGGTGSFYRLLPLDSLGYDVEPKFPGLQTADFLTVEIRSDRAVAVLGNPPFGKNASMAVRFFNHAAWQASVIALIVPRTFRKTSTENRLDPAFHLVCEEVVPDDAFLFRSAPYHVPALFQIWERRAEPRAMRFVEVAHPDFAFTTPDQADFAIQRVGARAGRLHHDRTMSRSSHYFIKDLVGGVERIMARIDFRNAVGNVAGNPSLAKSEIVALYREWIELRAGAQRAA